MTATFPCRQYADCSKTLYKSFHVTEFIKWFATFLLPILFFSTQIFGQSANIDQIRNGSASSPGNYYNTFNNSQWVNGNAGSSNAHYVEGMSIAYRTLLTGLTNQSSYEYIIEYDTKHSDAMAIDYLTHYQRLEPHSPFGHTAEVFDPRIFKSGSKEYLIGLVSTNTFAIPAPSQLPANTPVAGMPQNSFNALPAGERLMTILNGTITDISYVTQQSLSTGDAKASTSVKIRFTADKDSVVLAWGGHIGSRLDWGYTDPPANTHPRSAGGISGSPYHMRHIAMNTFPGLVNISLGNQDRSLSAAAVVPPPLCPMVADQTKCSGSNSFVFTISNPDAGTVYTWSFGTNDVGAVLQNTTGTSVTVIPGGGAASFTSGGSFTLNVSAVKNTITLTCPRVATGTIIKVAVAATATPTEFDLRFTKTSQLNTVLTGSSSMVATDYTYAWTQTPASGGSLSSTSIANPVFTATAVGSYTFEVTATRTIGTLVCSSKGSVVVNVSVSSPPCAVVGPSPICPGTTNSYVYDPTGDGNADAIPSGFTAAWTLENNTNGATPGTVTTGNTFSVTSSSTCKSEYTVRITLSLTGTAITFGCAKTVTVDDVTKPVITCPANKNLECGASTDPSNTGTATATDNCTTSPTITFSDAAVTANCTSKAGIDRTWTATDACGNTATCVQQIRFVDLVKPVITCPANANLECGASTDPSNTGSATATDNCTTPVVTYTDAAVAANCTGKAGINRTWLATDGCGNTATCVQQIRFVDLVKPVITCPANANLECGASTAPSNTGTATATDNCTTPVVTFTDAAVAANCTGRAGIDRTWLATDGCGNTATCVQQIRFVDLVKPVITCPANANLECGASTAPSNTGTATATDNCTTPVVTYTDAAVAANCTGKAGIDRTWLATDGCGNTATCVQQIRFVDLVKPVITCPANVNLQCGASTNPSNTGTATATDNCTTPVVTYTDVAVAANCTGKEGINRTWLATDGCGNTATCVQQIRFVDLIPPVITNCPADIVIECSASILPGNTGAATATDNCGPVTPTYTDVPVTTGCQTIITRTWTVADGCGNSASCVQRIIKRDRTAPIITCPATGNATATDNCSAIINIYFRDAGTTRTWTAIDESGNFSTCNQTIGNLRSELPISTETVKQTTVTTAEATPVNKTEDKTVLVPKLNYEKVSALILEAFPNPYANSVNFRFVSPKGGKAILEVYDMLGRKMDIIFQGTVEPNVFKTVNYKIAELKRVPMVYRLSVNGEYAHGSLLPSKGNF